MADAPSWMVWRVSGSAANTVAGVAQATVSFMTQKMKVEFADGSDEKAVMENVVKACKRVEDDCEIYL